MKSISRRNLIVTAGLFAAGALAGCGSDKPAASTGSSAGSKGGNYKIGVLQLTEHGALDQTNKGFVDALNDSGISCSVDQQNAQNDQSACQTIASKFVNDGVDLVFAIATPAAQAMAGATSDIPIVGSAITDYAESGLVADNDAPGGNVTGSSDLTPVADQIDLMLKLCPTPSPSASCSAPAESNSEVQVKLAEETLDAAGVAHERYSVSSSNEYEQVVQSMVGGQGRTLIYAPTDNTIAAGMAAVSDIANENGLPTIVGCDTMVEDGGLASYSINYHDLGYKAGEMAVKNTSPREPTRQTCPSSTCRARSPASS